MGDETRQPHRPFDPGMVQTLLDGSPVPTFTLDDFSPRDLWLVAATDDGRWLVHDLPEPDDRDAWRPTLLARNGGTLLLSAPEGSLRFDLD